jgi:outer membrane autotransporter protein
MTARRLLLACLLVASALGGSRAWADCQPDPAASGQTVTCAGNDPDGFTAGAGVNNLTVNVQPGATVQDNGLQAIGVNNGNGVTNNGAINAATDLAIGILATDNNVITNAGSITASGFVGTGIDVESNNAIVNSGTIAATNALGTGITVTGVNNSVTNGGAITAGEGGNGIQLFDGGNTVINNGTITVINAGFGIANVAINPNVITNNGTITVGASPGTQGVGISAGSNATVTNNSTINVGADGVGIQGSGGTNTIVNNGSIVVGPTLTVYSAGIDLSSNFAGGNTVVNNGGITAGDGGVGIVAGDSNTITNNGKVIVGANGNSIGSCALCLPATNDVVVNNGRLDGKVALTASGGAANTLDNFGLITITNAGTAVGANHLIDGTFNQFSGGVLGLRVNAAGASDTLSATTANLGGTLRAVVQAGLYGNSTTYLGVVNATDPIGTTFASVSSSSVFFNVTASYKPTSVDLTLTRFAFGEVPGETLNEQAVGTALEAAYSTGLTGKAATFFATLLTSSSLAPLDQLSGEGTSGTQDTAFGAGSQFMSLMTGQTLSWLGGGPAGTNGAGAPMQYAAEPEHPALAVFPLRREPPAPWGAWAAGFGDSQKLRGDAVVGSADLSHHSAGGAVGLDYRANPDFLFGLAAAGSSSGFSVADRATSGKLDGAHLGAYGAAKCGAFYALGNVSYSRFDNSTTRTISGIGPSETATGSFASDELGGRLELGWRQPLGRFNVAPFAAAQVLQLWQRGYAETSVTAAGAPGILGLSFRSQQVSSLPTFLGAQIDTQVDFADGASWRPYLRASWVHEFEPRRDVTAALLLFPGNAFTVDGASAASDAVRIEGGGDFRLTRTASLFGSFGGEFSDRTNSLAGTGGLRVVW